MKQWLKRMYYQFRYNKKNVRIASGAVIGRKTRFEGANRIGRNTVFGGVLGYGSYIGAVSSLNGSVGRFCSIAAGVQVINGFHPLDAVSTHPAFFSTKKQCGLSFADCTSYKETRCAEGKYPIVIGNDVWIGQNAMLMAGICIGDGAVIAAGAVVTKDVPPYTVVGGVPAKEIRKRFDSETVEKLTRIAWWNWPVERLRENAADFADTDTFLKKWDTEVP